MGYAKELYLHIFQNHGVIPSSTGPETLLVIWFCVLRVLQGFNCLHPPPPTPLVFKWATPNILVHNVCTEPRKSPEKMSHCLDVRIAAKKWGLPELDRQT